MVTNPFGDIATLHDEDPSSRVISAGMQLGRYELLTRIGKGGMASVWAARQHGQRGFTKAVAVKTILPHLACEEEFEALFLREARIASTIRHPNVCEVYDLGEDRGTLYMAMEWVNGDSLASLTGAAPSSGPVHWPLVARIVADACAGLHAAHTTRDAEGQPMSILHRDISPQNILVSDSGIVKLADFGIAKASMSLSAMTRAGFMRGKVGYCSPERISGGAYDQRADIYAMGCVLYELLAGRPPFVSNDDVRLLVDITSGNYPPLVPSHEIPVALVDIVERAICADPDDRIASAEALRVSLETLLLDRKCLVSSHHLAGVVKARVGAKLQDRQRAIQTTLDRIGRLGRTAAPASLVAPTSRSLAPPAHASLAPPAHASLGPPAHASLAPPAGRDASWTPSAPAPSMWPGQRSSNDNAEMQKTLPEMAARPSKPPVRQLRIAVAALSVAVVVATALVGWSELRRSQRAAAVSLAAPSAVPLPSGIPSGSLVAPLSSAQLAAAANAPGSTRRQGEPHDVPAGARSAKPRPSGERGATRTTTSAPEEDDVNERLQLGLPPIPSSAPNVVMPSNPY